eukprot:Hpha_TRINITY_DN6501_c0_g1::TRINITY_DN6501_c0_g1_i1::g.45912::m.45912
MNASVLSWRRDPDAVRYLVRAGEEKSIVETWRRYSEFQVLYKSLVQYLITMEPVVDFPKKTLFEIKSEAELEARRRALHSFLARIGKHRSPAVQVQFLRFLYGSEAEVRSVQAAAEAQGSPQHGAAAPAAAPPPPSSPPRSARDRSVSPKRDSAERSAVPKDPSAGALLEEKERDVAALRRELAGLEEKLERMYQYVPLQEDRAIVAEEGAAREVLQGKALDVSWLLDALLEDGWGRALLLDSCRRSVRELASRLERCDRDRSIFSRLCGEEGRPDFDFAALRIEPSVLAPHPSTVTRPLLPWAESLPYLGVGYNGGHVNQLVCDIRGVVKSERHRLAVAVEESLVDRQLAVFSLWGGRDGAELVMAAALLSSDATGPEGLTLSSLLRESEEHHRLGVFEAFQPLAKRRDELAVLLPLLQGAGTGVSETDPLLGTPHKHISLPPHLSTTQGRWAALWATTTACALASGPVASWPTLVPLLLDAGVWAEDGDKGAHANLDAVFSIAIAVQLGASLPAGWIFDRYGGRAASLGGALLASTGLLLMGLATYFPADLAWLLWLAYPVAMLGGQINSFGVFSFLWLLPEHQNFISSMAGGTAALSDMLVLVAVGLHSCCGLFIGQFFLVLSGLSLCSGVVCYAVGPSRSTCLELAASVLTE